MKIKRIQVEEGFLHGLDLEFSDRLNVIIGPRGSGKTSIIELIRFCLDVDAYSDIFTNKAREQALAILGSGQVTLTVEEHETEYLISRTADEADIRKKTEFKLPIILSQNEIEMIGLLEEGKLRLIDSFLKSPERIKVKEESHLSEIYSLSDQLKSLSEEIENIDETIESYEGIDKEIVNTEKEQEKKSGTIKALKPLQDKLNEYANITTILAVQEQILQRSIELLDDWLEELRNVSEFPPELEDWPDSAGDVDLLNNARNDLEKSLKYLSNSIKSVERALEKIKDLEKQTLNKRIQLDNEVRVIRKQVEEIQEGAGILARRLTELKEKKGQKDALLKLKVDREKSFLSVKERRSKKLDSLDKIRSSRYSSRKKIIKELNNNVSPQIEIVLSRSAIFIEYENAIIDTLRGSGLKYRSLATKIAKAMSPREYSEAIEEHQASTISELARIQIERANRIIAYSNKTGVGRILTSIVEDGITLSLLVGVDYKTTESVSTGQRCTVILPILLCDHGRALIIDQPEDNLDNAYIVDTVVKSFRDASKNIQLICTTHNPNIPVLGEAELVISLDSDGKRGFVRTAKKLDDPATIEAITTFMEGGLEAFQRRAEFYQLNKINE